MRKAITDKGKIMTILGLSLITISVLFIGSAYISLNGMIEVKFAYDFNITEDFIVSMIDENTFVSSNQTFTRQDAIDNKMRVGSLLIPFDYALSNLNESEMNKFLCNTSRSLNQNQYNNIYKQMLVITPEFISLRSLEFVMKLPTGNRISYILLNVGFKREGYIDTSIGIFGVIKDTDISMRNIGKDKTIIKIERISFDSSEYDSYYNFMLDYNNNSIPLIYPYRIQFSIEKTFLTLSDMLRSG